jgi:hypothetical protein
MAARGAIRIGGGVHCHGDLAHAHAACSGPMMRTSCHAQARLLGTAAEYYHHQPEAAPLAPRGRWAQSPGPASCVARAGHTTLKIRRPPPGRRNLPESQSRPRVAQKTRTQLQAPHLDPRAPDSESRPGSRGASCRAGERPDLGPGSRARSPAQSRAPAQRLAAPASGCAPRPLLLLVTSSLGPKESPQEPRSAPRGSVGLAGCAGPWARPHSSLSARLQIVASADSRSFASATS